MAWDEWEQLKSDALLRREAGMSLDGVPSGAAGGASRGAVDLKTNGSGKAAAAKALREQIRPDTAKAGHHTAESSAAMARAFSAWAFGPALGDVQSEWELQVDNLMGRLASEQTSLEQTKQDFQEVDHAVKGRLTGIVTELAPARDV